MKNLISLFFTLLFTLFINAQDFEVDHCQVAIYVNKDGYFDVVENYALTFSAYKHGIYREIQTKYDLLNADGGTEERRIKIRNIEVPGHKFDSPPNFTQDFNDDLLIKIGDEDKTIIGAQQYQIKYRVYNAFLFEDDHINFYWNIKPNGWQATFKILEFSVHFPEDLQIASDNIHIYAGRTGTTEESDAFRIQASSNSFQAISLSNFSSIPGESVTVLVKLPPNSIIIPEPLWPFWTNYGWSLILALLIAAFYWVWNRFGKDDKVVSTTSYFPPQNINPAMAGFLIDDQSDTSDLISLIPHWGSKGLIRVDEIEKKGFFGSKDTKLTRLGLLSEDAPVYEKQMFEGLFGTDSLEIEKEVLVSSLKDVFHSTMSSAKTQLKSEAQIYYDSKARKTKTLSMVAIVIIGILMSILFINVWGLIACIAGIIVTVFLLFMSKHLIKKNKKGTAILSELKGFKQFIKVAEVNKLRMLIVDDPNYFESTMSYALAFGLFAQWSKKFETLNIPPPNWYHSAVGLHTMNSFSNSFANTMASAQRTMISSPSSNSGGGGSSGGGFGGGGGGSW